MSNILETLLIYAASEGDANMLYATGFFVPDPFIFFKHRGRKYAVMSDLEIDRAKRQADVDTVLSLSSYQQQLKNTGKRATTTVPVVMVISVDPVAIGIVKSLAQPGGNITGLVSLNRDLRKQGLELLKEAVPGLQRVGVLWNSEGRASATAFKDYEAAAPPKRIQLQSLEVRGSTPNLEGAFQAAVKGRAGALITVSNAALARYPKQIAELALKNRLPSMSERSEYAAASGFMDYSANYAENFRRVAVYVDKILKGAKPADLPMEPTKFDLTINLKTAKQLGVAVPPDVVKRANRVIK